MKFHIIKDSWRTILLLSLLNLLLFQSTISYAQTKDATNHTLWINGGLGISTVGSLAANANFNVQIRKFLVSVRIAGYLERTGMFSGGDEFSDLALLFGIGSTDPKFYSSIAAGIAKVDGSRYHGRPGLFSGGKRISIESTVGLAIESKLNIKVSNGFCIGLSPYININKEQTFFCLTFCLGIGKLN